tara:strand:+ start:101 stop:808 length:708 start_codon:yes stop_codon:yes gene_type:complete
MATVRGLQNFMQAIGKSGGISASNLYEFQIQPTSKLIEFFKRNVTDSFLDMVGSGSQLNLQLLCNEIQLPGVTYSAFDIKSVHKGITQKHATAKVYNELDVSFFMDGTSMPLRFFRAWQDYIQNGVHGATSQYYLNDIPYKRAFASNYYEDYACDMILTKLEKFETFKEKDDTPRTLDLEPKYRNAWQARLVKAYPYTVASIPYSSGAAQLVKVTVGFYYEYSDLKVDKRPLAFQ